MSRLRKQLLDEKKIGYDSRKLLSTPELIDVIEKERTQSHQSRSIHGRAEWKEIYNRFRNDVSGLLEDGYDLIEEAKKMDENFDSVVMIARKEDLEDLDDGDFGLPFSLLGERKLRVGAGGASLKGTVPFSTQPSIIPCLGTGFFLKSNVIATAAHVLNLSIEGKPREQEVQEEQRSLKNLVVIRNLHIAPEKKLFKGRKIRIPKEDIFDIVEKDLSTDNHRYSTTNSDWATVRVEPRIPKANLDIKGVVIAKNPYQVKFLQSVYCVGHGLALPKKMLFNGKVIKNNLRQDYFECRLEGVYPGQSGSPIFDANSHKLIGMLIRGSALICKHIEEGEEIYHLSSNNTEEEGEECQRMHWHHRG